MALNTESVIAANRFGLGAAPGELERIGGDARDWLRTQVQTTPPLPHAFRVLPGSASALESLLHYITERRTLMKRKDAADAVKQLRTRRTSPPGLYRQHALARALNAIRTDIPFHERLVHFWSNHFALSTSNEMMHVLAGPFEVEAIRPNVCGHFLDLLLAVEKHPGMLVYLNNYESVGPRSEFATHADHGRNHPKFGINENLGRETLELHTLGVGSGYTQKDVTTYSLAITGWSVGGLAPEKEGAPGLFQFKPTLHEPGPKTILGKRYSQSGIAQGEAVLHDLAVHPATARHVATKLARHFIADDPPASAIARISNAFMSSGGHLPTVYDSLLDSPEAWQNVRAKYKTPHEYVCSTMRALNFTKERAGFALKAFRALGQSPWQPGSPAGWPDTAAAWSGPESLYGRVEFAAMVADHVGNRLDPEPLALAMLGPTLSERSLQTVRQAESAEQGLALLLASPEFQRR